MWLGKGSKVSFMAGTKIEEIELAQNVKEDDLIFGLDEIYEDVRQETICVNGQLLYNFIGRGYISIDNPPKSLDVNIPSFIRIKNIKEVLKLGLRKGDAINLKGLSSFVVQEVRRGNNMMVVYIA
jgi:hypothetical protein